MRILIIEDDRQISDFIARGLGQQGFAVESSADGNEGLELALAGEYDCLIVDIMLPGIDGLEIVRSLRGQGHNPPVLILSARSELDSRLEGFSAGADDYLIKPFSFAELQARVFALIRRSERPTSKGDTGTQFKVGDLELDLVKRQATLAGTEVELQNREFALLEYLMRNSPNVVSKTMILEQIWNYHFDPQTNVVDVLVHRLRSKVDPEHRLIHTVRGAGYVLKNIQR
jgi:two-component system OmpR family response regulator